MSLLLIRPYFFGSNPQALNDNTFMESGEDSNKYVDTEAIALQEHQALIDCLKQHHIHLIVYNNENPETPDAVFANNWLTVHPELNTMVIYPMYLENRQKEIREDILQALPYQRWDLRHSKKPLEGTGSIVFDHENKIIYAAISIRTHRDMVQTVANQLGYKCVCFHTSYKDKPIYHTNVMMAIGESWVIVCLDAIDVLDRSRILHSLKTSKKHIIYITLLQMEAFCGNCLEVINIFRQRYTVMSTRAYNAFHPYQKKYLEPILHVPLDILETVGGGGVRCCLTQI